ncbi:MAG: hypothetical protein ACMUIG_08900 [Thermoplasmatota archaeon]
MKVGRVIAVVIVFLMTSVIFSIPVNAQSVLEIDEYLPLTVGDYFEYDYNIDDQLTDAVENDDDYFSFKDVTTEYIRRVTGSELVTIDDESHDCWITETTIKRKYTYVGDGEAFLTDTYDIQESDKIWLDKDSHMVMKSEDTQNYVFTRTYPPDTYETYVMEIVTTTRYDYSSVPDIFPFPLKVGKSWSTQQSYTINTTQKVREKSGEGQFSDWSFGYDETDESTRSNLEIVSQNEVVVPYGTFQTLKMKQQIVGQEAYTFTYLDEYGMTVSIQAYVQGALAYQISLKDFKYDSAKDTDEDGYIDLEDEFPNDASEWMDTDEDGVGDNGDEFPNDAAESEDTDDDGVGDNADKFPSDAAASVDSDGDGYPDEWNPGKTEDDSTTGLKLDKYPTDVNKYKEEESVFSNWAIIAAASGFCCLLLIVFLIFIILIIVFMKGGKKKKKKGKKGKKKGSSSKGKKKGSGSKKKSSGKKKVKVEEEEEDLEFDEDEEDDEDW